MGKSENEQRPEVSKTGTEIRMPTTASQGDQQRATPEIKPEQWLSPKELAAHFGLNEESAYRWHRELIPDVHPKTKKQLIRYAGTARIFFHIDAISFLEEQFEARHDGR